MKRALSFLLSLALLCSSPPFAHADLRATNGGFGPIAATNGTISTAVTGVTTMLAASWAPVVAPADVTEDTLATITLPANTLGANGVLRIQVFATFTNNANAKTLRVRFSGGAGTQYLSTTPTTQQSVWATVTIANRNATNSQGGGFVEFFGNNSVAESAAAVTSAVDTTAQTTIVITAQKAVNTDTIQLEGYTVEVIH